MRVFKALSILVVLCFVTGSYFDRQLFAQAPYPNPTATLPALPSGSPFPTITQTCGYSNNNCNQCTSGTCPPSEIPGQQTTCTNFCNYTTGICGFTCSVYQSTCTGGWGAWGVCDNCWQFRVCNDNPQLGQTRPCGVDCPGSGGGGDINGETKNSRQVVTSYPTRITNYHLPITIHAGGLSSLTPCPRTVSM